MTDENEDPRSSPLWPVLRAIDDRVMAGTRERLRVNDPDREPTPRSFVPSRYPSGS
jgi:hypothetical protein